MNRTDTSTSLCRVILQIQLWEARFSSTLTRRTDLALNSGFMQLEIESQLENGTIRIRNSANISCYGTTHLNAEHSVRTLAFGIERTRSLSISIVLRVRTKDILFALAVANIREQSLGPA